MKKLKLAVILSGFLVVSTSIFAAGSLDTQSVQGAWELEYTKGSAKSAANMPREDTWVFNNNGTVVIKHIPRDGGYYDQLPVKYEIEDGLLKIGLLGRAGRFDKFTLIDIDDKNMVLKAKFGDVYHFIKK
ncbi:hypothetical protein BMR05_15995 [Methylococcaceae bacterium HT4]|nr:hypothetical protein BMR10_16480 [Methylococcaceae bacterium CS4]TXK93403.1 hypothetical protein BMR11_17005 [Methylococcaceae bacterium CS5]TXL02567.1 hypothetical protein BMR07_17510 [Methylococcaceae bacterium CS1]TXL03306.1 hypothetical protein BMR08_17275 [Methylococcaceae bacterium CS2]TXL11661.1 hypothetical protein BMR05_15995 [Methylococcaceae bacterium HT4]TXL12705.1 hypothetical protein BMR04_15115 [Methylococcaceae bacterium HT3]TXL16395.1 hypothetical protein BMR06_15810 [Meth